MSFSKISAALWLASIVVDGAARAEEPSHPSRTCYEIVRNASTSDNNDKCVAMAGALAANRNGKLILRMDNGQRKVFADPADPTQMSGYGFALMDFYPATHIFVVGDMGDDSGSFQAIDGRTGHVTDFGGAQPHYAPHGDWIVLDSYDEDEMGAERSTFSVLDARGAGKPKSVWSSKTDRTTLPGAAEFVAWRDDAHVELALPDGYHLILTHSGDGPWHYDLADLSTKHVKSEEETADKKPAAPSGKAPTPPPDQAAKP